MNEIIDKTILVTGGAGTIGSQFIKGLLHKGFTGEIIIFDRSETSLVFLKQDLEGFENCKFILGDILDINMLQFVFEKFSIQIIVHCAAYKQVPFMQKNLYELFRNNVEGLLNVLSFSEIRPLESFLFISTDKAVYPSNYMGITKRIGELLVDDYNNTIEKTNFFSLRFGNVLESNGSVLQLFERQWEMHNKIFVTNKNAKRFFIMPEDIYSFIVDVLVHKNSNSTFFIGKYKTEIKIVELAMEFLKKKKVHNSSDFIDFTSLRSGEKIFESLHYNFEQKEELKDSRVMLLTSKYTTDNNLKNSMERLVKQNTPLNQNLIKNQLDKISKTIYFR